MVTNSFKAHLRMMTLATNWIFSRTTPSGCIFEQACTNSYLHTNLATGRTSAEFPKAWNFIEKFVISFAFWECLTKSISTVVDSRHHFKNWWIRSWISCRLHQQSFFWLKSLWDNWTFNGVQRITLPKKINCRWNWMLCWNIMIMLRFFNMHLDFAEISHKWYRRL